MSYLNKTDAVDVDGNANLDPITGAPGAHPIGTGVGAALGGAAAGAVAGTVVGPVGTVIGAAVGAIVGGLAGKGVAEKIDPTIEQAYWRETYKDRPYVNSAIPLTTMGRPTATASTHARSTLVAVSMRSNRICRATGTAHAANRASVGIAPSTPRGTRGIVSAIRSSAQYPATLTTTASK